MRPAEGDRPARPRNRAGGTSKRFRAWRAVLESWLARGAMAGLGWLPRPVLRTLAAGLGGAGYLCSVRLRRIGRANLELALGGALARRDRERILRRSFQSFALVVLDAFWFAKRTEARIRRWVRFERPLREVLAGGAHVCLTGHLGNWELLGQAAALEGFPLASVAMPLKNPAVDELFNRHRQALGQVIIPRQGAVRALLRLLRGGGNVALLLDQNTPVAEGGVFVEFFGRPVLVSPAAAVLAARAEAGIVFGFCLPDDRGGYLVRLPGGLPAPPDGSGAEETRDWTARITRVYEEEIRRRPEHWLWTYKRWKYIRPGDPPAEYPFYAGPAG